MWPNSFFKNSHLSYWRKAGTIDPHSWILSPYLPDWRKNNFLHLGNVQLNIKHLSNGSLHFFVSSEPVNLFVFKSLLFIFRQGLFCSCEMMPIKGSSLWTQDHPFLSYPILESGCRKKCHIHTSDYISYKQNTSSTHFLQYGEGSFDLLPAIVYERFIAI